MLGRVSLTRMPSTQRPGFWGLSPYVFGIAHALSMSALNSAAVPKGRLNLAAPHQADLEEVLLTSTITTAGETIVKQQSGSPVFQKKKPKL